MDACSSKSHPFRAARARHHEDRRVRRHWPRPHRRCGARRAPAGVRRAARGPWVGFTKTDPAVMYTDTIVYIESGTCIVTLYDIDCQMPLHALYRVTNAHIAEAPWSAAEWAVALLFVELLQAQLGRQVAYLLLLCRASPPPDRKRSKNHSVCYMFA